MLYDKIKLYYFCTLKNFGDALNINILKYLGVEYSCVDLNEANFVAIGSILHNIITDEKPDEYSCHERIDVWGSGFIKNSDCEKEYFIKSVNIHALRGKLSKTRCEAILGSKLDGIALGDPGLLTSRAVPIGDIEKKYDVGIIPHYVDKNSDLLNKIELKNKSYRVIDVQGETDQICKEICECRMILSSAMHGLIAADSYGVPNRWIKFSDAIIGGNYKFNDYYSAFDIEGLEPVDLRQRTISDQDIDQFILNYPIGKDDVERICDDLEKAFPRRRVFGLPTSGSCLNKIQSERNESIEKNKQAIDYYDLAISNLYSGNFKKAEENISKYKSIINYDSFPKYDRRFLKYPELSIIVVGYNTGAKLVDCIESVLNNNAGNYEIIVVDNGGNEKIIEKLLEFKLLYIASPHNLGPSEGRNIGTYFAKGDIISFLDDDAVAGKDYVQSIIEAFKNDNVIGLRGKIMPKSTPSHQNNANHYDLGNNDLLIRYINTEGNSAFKKNEYLKLNGMNPLLFGHEGIDLSYRMEKEHDCRMLRYSPNVIIYHDYTESESKLHLKEKRHSVMMSYLNYLHPGIDDFICGGNFSESCKSLNEHIAFSIIMPTYNRKYCIQNAIDSLLRQTYQRFELIIIDDGSTDGTGQFLHDMYAQEIINKKIKYIKLPTNQGAAFARNIGIRESQFRWIGYLDTDNHMHNDFLETFANSIKNSAFEIHYAQVKLRQSQTIMGRPFDFDELLQFNYIDLGVLVHSCSLSKELGGFDVNLNRLIDWDLIIKYTERYPPKFIKKVLLDYDDNTESSRITNRVSAPEAYKQVILNYYSRIPPEVFIEKYTGLISRLKNEITMRDEQIASLYSSNSWRITRPLRMIGQGLKRFKEMMK
jgi:glycosyltransferase involved in cell wall biosynthesis